jgi:hypothetical protein
MDRLKVWFRRCWNVTSIGLFGDLAPSDACTWTLKIEPAAAPASAFVEKKRD